VDYIVFLRRVWVASLGHRLTGYGGIVDPKAEGLDQAAICRYDVTLFEQNNVPGHNLLGC
jgi:hypothetical protein